MADDNTSKARWRPTWLPIVVALLMTAEYTRLVVTSDELTYRVFVLVAWICISVFLIYRRVRSRD